MYDFYSPIIKDFEIDHKNISYYFYYTDLPEKFLSTFSETYRLEEVDKLRELQKEFIGSQQELLEKFARYVCDRINSK